jgi:hypothetical protein
MIFVEDIPEFLEFASLLAAAKTDIKEARKWG